jgi:ELWxxDGT repeat protein
LRKRNVIFFSAKTVRYGEELWKSSGTKSGTKLVEDINPDSPPGARCDQGECGIPKGWSHPDTVTVMGKQVFFAADDGKHGVELWKSDGTRSGTKLVKDINTGQADSDPDQLTAYRGVLLFRADDGVHGSEMWRSDSTKANTALLIDLEPGADGSSPGGLTTSGPLLYFAASNPSAGEELWAVSRRGIGG